MAKALKMASVGPVMVTIRSGQFPSEMLILAPLCKKEGQPWSSHSQENWGGCAGGTALSLGCTLPALGRLSTQP